MDPTTEFEVKADDASPNRSDPGQDYNRRRKENTPTTFSITRLITNPSRQRSPDVCPRTTTPPFDIHRWSLRLALTMMVMWWLWPPVTPINLPVVLPSVSQPDQHAEPARNPPSSGQSLVSPLSGPHHGRQSSKTVDEEEVMMHFYKNGALGAGYSRKASTLFMVELFNDLIRGVKALPRARRGQGKDGFPLADTVRSFSARGVTYSRNQKTAVNFDLPYLPRNERLRSAEIRFLRHSVPWQQTTTRYKLTIAVSREGHVMQKVVLRERAVVQREYFVFDISRVLEKWVNRHHANISLKVRVPHKLVKAIPRLNNYNNINTNNIYNSSLASTSLVALYLEDGEFLKSVYHSYTSDDHASTSTTDNDNSHGRSSGSSTPRGKRHSGHDHLNPAPARSARSGAGGRSRRWYQADEDDPCRLYNFKVDFDLIGWGRWIVHPKNFNAKFCHGHCPSPVEGRFRPSNHAVLQSLMRHRKRRLAPPPCCVPVTLKPLSMLYFEFDEIVVRHHEDMVVGQCGCR